MKHPQSALIIALLFVMVTTAYASPSDPSTETTTQQANSYTIVDTGQDHCYDTDGQIMLCPTAAQDLFGQDANYVTTPPAYVDNGDGTVTDLNTGLMWQQAAGDKVDWATAMANANTFQLAGYTDWRLPTIKELYSLMDFNGVTGMDVQSTVPYIDTDYFEIRFDHVDAGQRVIDGQFWSSTAYVSTALNNRAATFGVNFIDGRIKGYPQHMFQYVRYVRGNAYGINDFVDNGDSTITDNATGLTWMQNDSGAGMDWEVALEWCEVQTVGGYNDWRLPNAKELQSIVDYSRSPDTTNSAAIDPLFNTSSIIDEGGQTNYPFFWTSTTHLDGPNFAVYVAFGEALGYMEQRGGGGTQLQDVHGAGAQRSDPKTGDPSRYASGHGPQGDVVRINNYVRCVRSDNALVFTGGDLNGPTAALLGGGQGGPGQAGQPQGGQGQPQGGQGQGDQQPGGLDLAAAAAQLGVTEQQLRDALGPPPPDFAAAAAQLGVTEQQLIDALGIPAGGGQGGPPRQ